MKTVARSTAGTLVALWEVQMKTNNKRRFKLKAAIATLSALAAIGSIAPAAAENRECSVDTLLRELIHGPEGSWLYTVTIPDPSGSPLVFQGTETYFADGGYSEADQLSVMPGYLATPGHGAWKSSGPHKFLLTYVNLTHDAAGNPTGTSRVRQTTQLSPAGNTYSGSGDYDYYDVNGGIVASGTFTITAKRIAVQAPD